MNHTSLQVFLTPARHESRFLREASALIEAGLAGRVLLLALWEPGLPMRERLADGVEVERVRLWSRGLPRLLPFQWLKGIEWGYRIVARARAVRPSWVVAHSIGALPAAAAAAQAVGAPLLYEAHELETERNGLRGLRQAFDRIVERTLIRRAAAVVCVSDSIADWYEKKYRLPRPAVVRNVPEAWVPAAPPGESILRRRFAIPPGALLFIYQGGLFHGRRIEQLLRVFARTHRDRHLVLMGYGELEQLVRQAAAEQANIHFHPAVRPGEVLQHTAGADVGVAGVENVCLSYYLSLPNKVFEYLAAGVPMLVPDYPEMRTLIGRLGCGWVVGEADDAWVNRINSLTAHEVVGAKGAARIAASEYTWEREARVLLDVHQRLLAQVGHDG